MSTANNTNSADNEALDMTQESDVTTSAVASGGRGKHMDYGQVRGLTKLFEYKFVHKDHHGRNRRVSKQLLNEMFNGYKDQVLREYGRVIKGTLASEKVFYFISFQVFQIENMKQAFYKRYTDPLTFIKYKLKRSTDLVVTELRDEDQAFYYEIGGKATMEDLLRDQASIQSIGDGAAGIRRKRPRIAPAVSSQELKEDTLVDSPHLEMPKVEGDDNQYTPALHQLKSQMTAYQLEQLKQKRIEIASLFQEKCTALLNMCSECLSSRPELIGLIPFSASEEQTGNAFDYWLHHHVSKINESVQEMSLFKRQITSLRDDEKAWKKFLHGWKLERILFGDDFLKIWEWIVTELNVAIKNDKEEANAVEEVFNGGNDSNHN